MVRSVEPSLTNQEGIAQPQAFFTLVFKGELRDIKGNPFLIRTPYGLPMHCCVGNAFDEFDTFIEVFDEMLAALKGLLHYEIGHVDAYAGQRVIEARAAVAKAEGITEGRASDRVIEEAEPSTGRLDTNNTEAPS